MPHVLVAGSLDPVCVVPSAFDGAGTGAVPAPGVEILVPGGVGHDAARRGPGLLRGGKAGPAARRMTRRVRLNLTRSGSIPALVAAAQIRALSA